MTPIKWVDRNDLYESDVYSDLTPKLLQPMIPVLTLDAIEAWLEKQKKHPEGTGQLTINYFVDDLLAQVQAWRTQGDTR
jgi:hypothetical protein